MTDSSSSSPFNPRTIGIILAIAIISLGAVLVLAGWAPDLKSKNKSGPHPYSTAATGYAGFVRLLDDQGHVVEISRRRPSLVEYRDNFTIYTLPERPQDWDEMFPTERSPALIVLPKWFGMRDPVRRKRQIDLSLVDDSNPKALLSDMVKGSKLVRQSPKTRFQTPFGSMNLKLEEKAQLIESDTLIPIVSQGDKILIGQIENTEVFILSDPDLLNTFGLSHKENARLASQLVDYIKYYPEQTISFDATAHGFARSENLLKMMFDIPFIGATLTALAAILLLGWGALTRFGPPKRTFRAIALGKQALIDNSSNLIDVTGRYHILAPRYLTLAKRRAAKEMGVPRTLTDAQLTELFDRLGPETESGKLFSEMEATLLQQRLTFETLRTTARDLHRWRDQIIGRTTNEH